MLEVVSSSPAASARTPPHNLEAEKSVLGAVFIKPAAFDEVATSLAVDDFFLPAHREIFEAMVAIDKRRQPLDVLAVADELKTAGLLARDRLPPVPRPESLGFRFADRGPKDQG